MLRYAFTSVMDYNPLKSISHNKVILKLLLIVVFYPSNRKVTHTILWHMPRMLSF